MACPFQWLVITDGTTSDGGIRNQVDLVSSDGFCVLEEGDWRPAITMPKGGGVWKDSQLADGRRPADFKAQNVVESMTLTISAQDQDALIRDTQELRRLLNKARSYGTTDWQSEPVWIEAKSPGETNMRYAIVWDWATPNDGNPYEQPFWQRVAGAGMNDFVLSLEREPYWRADVPGESTCVPITGSQTYDEGPPWHLEFNATTSIVTVPDAGAIQDLADAAMTVEAWVRTDGWGENNEGFIATKARVFFVGWTLRIDNVNGLVGIIECATDDGTAASGIAEFSPDNLWHHVAMTWNDATYTNPRLWIGGIEQTNAVQARNGAVVSDVGRDLIIGNLSAASRTWDGDIGWTRISDNIRYAATFTPPVRCTLPAIDGNTVGQWIGVENTGAPILDQDIVAGNDGTQANCTFDGCAPEYGRAVATCDDEVYISVKHNVANITNVHYFDSNAGAWSANLMTVPLPFAMLPNPVLAADVIVFGIDTSLADSGPFCSLVFDIGTAMTLVTGTQWKYSSVGADPTVNWNNLTVQDNTDQNGAMTGMPFDTLGVGSVHWEQPAAWTVQNPTVAAVALGITGYWVAMDIITVAGGDTPPQQQLRDIYSIVWPYVEIASTAVLGDVEAILRLIVRNQADNNNSTAVIAWENRVICGLRSVSRGSNFTPYINISDEQNPAGMTVGAAAGFIADATVPTGRSATFAAPAGGANIIIETPVVTEYIGSFHGYVRYQMTAGTPADTTIQVVGQYEALPRFFESAIHVPANTNAYQVFDFGRIDIGAGLQGQIPTLVLLTINTTGGGGDSFKLIDLILIPIDEWALDTYDYENSSGLSRLGARGEADNAIHLDIDAITSPKSMTSLLKELDGRYRMRYLTITGSRPMLHANTNQRMWFFATRLVSTGSTEDRAEPWIANTIQLHHVAQYYSLRGNR